MAQETRASHSAALRNPGPRPANSWVFFDGQFARYGDVHLGLMTHALHYGTGCFEGIRAYWSDQDEQLHLLQPAPHYDRLRRSAQILRMRLEPDTETLVRTTVELLRRNRYRTDVYIRPILFKADEEIGVRLHGLREVLGIYTVPFGDYVEVDSGIRCMVSTWRRVSDQSVPARAKITGAYINSALAKSEAVEAGYDEAIVLTAEGHVSEGSAENLFMVKDGAVVTPPVTDDILEGVTRRLLMAVVREDMGLPVVERSIDRTELYTCDELLLCGTGAQISPVIEADRRPVGAGVAGPVTRELQRVYFDACRGLSTRHADWTVPVY